MGVAKMLGCILGLKDSITAITFVALGTSLPDTFASKEATIGDDTADAAITNVTGSNSVNVFLGLGIPWSSSVMRMTKMPRLNAMAMCCISFPFIGRFSTPLCHQHHTVVAGPLLVCRSLSSVPLHVLSVTSQRCLAAFLASRIRSLPLLSSRSELRFLTHSPQRKQPLEMTLPMLQSRT